MAVIDDQKLLTADEVARLLRLKPSTIYEAAKKGRIPSVQLWKGRRKAVIRFRPADIDAMIRGRGMPSTPTVP